MVSKHAYGTAQLVLFLSVEALSHYHSSEHHRLLAIFRKHLSLWIFRSTPQTLVLHSGCHWVSQFLSFRHEP
jgi:hypothetical protein